MGHQLLKDKGQAEMLVNSECNATANRDSFNLRQRVAEGVFCTHSRLNANRRGTLEAAFLCMLVRQGLVTLAEMGAPWRIELEATTCQERIVS